MGQGPEAAAYSANQLAAVFNTVGPELLTPA
jgi:hypothetical protein